MALGNVRTEEIQVALLQAGAGVGIAAQSGRKEEDEEAICILPQQSILTAMAFLEKRILQTRPLTPRRGACMVTFLWEG